MKPGPCEDLGDLDLSQSRAKDLQTAHQVAHEIGESIHRLWQPDERIRAFLVETSRPRGDGERRHEEGTGGLRKGPTAGGPKLEDGQARRGWIIGPSVGLDLLHAGVLDADLFVQEGDLTLEPFDFRLVAKPGIEAVSGPAEGLGKSEIGEGNGVDSGRPNAPWPALGQGKGWVKSDTRHRGLPQEM
jgi:hypothetical protein